MNLWIRIPIIVLTLPFWLLLGVGWLVLVALMMCLEIATSAVRNRKPDIAYIWSEGLDMWDFWR